MRTESFVEKELSHDAFLGGRLRIAQPRAGYRAGIDPVLFAASIPARAGQSVLELGCGSGIAPGSGLGQSNDNSICQPLLAALAGGEGS